MLNQIAENVYYMNFSTETDRPCLGYIRGTERSMMVDSGNSPEHVDLFLKELDEMGLPYPELVFITHHHWDHTFGMAAIKERTGALTIVGERTNAILRSMRGYTWDMEHFVEYVADNRIPLFCRPHILLEYPDLKGIDVREGDIVFEGDLSVALGGETVRMRRIASSHTDECYILYTENTGVLFLGDSYSQEVIGDKWYDHKDKLFEQVAQLREIPFEKALPGHGELYTKEGLIKELLDRSEVADYMVYTI